MWKSLLVALLLSTAVPSHAENASSLTCEGLYKYSLETAKFLKGQVHDEAQAAYYLAVISTSISILGSSRAKHPLSLDMAASRATAYAAREVGLWMSKNRSRWGSDTQAIDCVHQALVETYGYRN